jgi:CHAD domain-containing protein
MVATIEARRFAGEQADRLLKCLVLQINRTAKSCDAAVVHKVRVSIRRFTQTISVFKQCFPGRDLRKIRRRLKKIMVVAGEVRNWDVALKFIAKSRLPNAVQLQSKLQRHRKESSRILARDFKRWVDGQMFLKWRAALKAALASSQDALGEAAIHEVSRRTLLGMAEDFFEHGNDAALPKSSPEDLHQFRIVAKKFRYTLELFAPLYGSSLNGEVARIKRAQTLLGEINDCVTVAGMVSRYDGGDRLASRLGKRQRNKTEEFRQYWSDEFRDRDWFRNRIDHLGLAAEPRLGIKKPAASSGSAPAAPDRKSKVVA